MAQANAQLLRLFSPSQTIAYCPKGGQEVIWGPVQHLSTQPPPTLLATDAVLKKTAAKWGHPALIRRC